MRYDEKTKKELEAKSIKFAHELATDLETMLHKKFIENKNDVLHHEDILQALTYSHLSSWFMAAHFAVCKEQDKAGREPPISQLAQEIVNYAVFMFKNFKIVRRKAHDTH